MMDYNVARAVLSRPERERLLTRRLEDLDGRLQELAEKLPESRMDEKFDRRFYSKMADSGVDYAIPGDLSTIEDVLTAIARTKDKLWDLQCEERAAQRKLEQETAKIIPGQAIMIGFADDYGISAEKLAS